MKLTATWSYSKSEGGLSKADVARLLESPTITEADFLRDVLFDVTNLYNDVCDKVFPGRSGPSPDEPIQ